MGERATFQLAGGAQAPARAREIVTIAIGVALPETLAYQASLLTSEIVTNSVLHGRAGEDDQIELALSWNGEGLRLEVTDEGPGFQVSAPDPDRPGGWGLALVETMSERWGIERGDRTRVWFELGLELV